MAIFNGFSHIHGILMVFLSILMVCEYSSADCPLMFCNSHENYKKYLDCSSLEAAPTTYDASSFSLRKVSLFPFSIRPICDLQIWPFKYRQHLRGRNWAVCARSKSHVKMMLCIFIVD